jgi:4-hydroxy-3-methylbut-2-enyl diphosphate reductase
MKIKLAEESGFCFGVKKALDRVNAIENKEDVYVLGKLIHNPQVIEELKKQGINFIENIEEIEKGTLVISAHGISDNIIEKAKEKNLAIIDTTCPLVKNVHNITKNLEKQGYKIIIFGDKEHTEVKGIKGNLKDPIIISNIAELDNLNQGKYALVSQTTQDIIKFNEISERLKEKIRDIIISDTICSATKLRQQNAKQLAKEVDLMLVIGGYNSSNTKRLKEICSKIIETKHIESKEELKREWFENKENIGITAGASTPEKVIKEVIDKMTNISS